MHKISLFLVCLCGMLVGETQAVKKAHPKHVRQAARKKVKPKQRAPKKVHTDHTCESVQPYADTPHDFGSERPSTETQRYFDLTGTAHEQPRVTFADVAGLDEAKAELADIVNYLKNAEKYRAMDARVPHGILLVGDPGNGKTLLARAVAGEVGCDFFCVSGSAFIEQYVGLGASRVRDLFVQARRYAPCIVFIDEIDSVGGMRTMDGSAAVEYTQTLNQLLTEIDGFEVQQNPIIVIAATNRADMLDPALVRPGRFDRTVSVTAPGLAARESILRVHAAKKKVEQSVDFATLARQTVGFSAAYLANLVNEAALNAVNAGHRAISQLDFEQAYDKVLLGRESAVSLTADERELTAYHESGHALTRVLLGSIVDPLRKVTIIPRGKALGVTFSLPDRDRCVVSKQHLTGELMTLFGGRVAEELVFSQITSGASEDFRVAAHMARQMVCSYGMAPDLGMIVYEPEQYRMYSEQTRETIDREAQKILIDAYAATKKLLFENRSKLNLLAKTLLQKKTMRADEVYAVLGMWPPSDQHL